MSVIIKTRLANVLIILTAAVFLPLSSLSDEKEIKIGYSFDSTDSVHFHFNVPVTQQMRGVIEKQEGVDSIMLIYGRRHELIVYVGKMFSRKEVLTTILKALETEIFTGKPLKAYPMK